MWPLRHRGASFARWTNGVSRRPHKPETAGATPAPATNPSPGEDRAVSEALRKATDRIARADNPVAYGAAIERLARALLEPPKPMNQALKAAYAWHKEHVEMRE